MTSRQKTKTRTLKSANELAWKKVDDDLEDIDADDGFFYGLEEIDGVGVDVTDGALNFLVDETAEKLPEKSAKSSGKSTEETSGSQDFYDFGDADGLDQEQSGNESNEDDEPDQKDLANDDDMEIDDEVDYSALESLNEKQITQLGDWPTLDPAILTALDKLNFKEPTKIQLESIPQALEGKDIIGKAATGSGKTLAYGLPIVHAFLQNPKAVKGIIIAPTRELAHQIRDHLNAVMRLCYKGKTSGIVAVTGGLAIQKQLRLLESNPVAVVGTPGRLAEVLGQMPMKQLKAYQEVPTLVLDEADRLVQSNSFEDLDKILDLVGRGVATNRQTMVFSATFEPELWAHLNKGKKRPRTQDIRKLLEDKLSMKKSAVFVDVDPKQAVASNIIQGMIECPAQEKDLYLYYFLLLYPGKTIVFVNSIFAVKRLTPLLRELGVGAFGVHSDMIQKQRLRSIERFKAAPNGVLIATDVAARGLDVPQVDHVVHYHLPRSGDMYIHRSGRTARAGAEGVSIVLCAADEVMALNKLRKLISSSLQGLDVDYDVLEKLRRRVLLAKKIADSNNDGAHQGKKESWLEQAANDLEIVLSDDERDELAGTKKKKNAVDTRILRAELRDLLSHKVAPNRRYLTSGAVNMAQIMLRQPDAVVPGREMVTALDELRPSKKQKATPKKEKKEKEEVPVKAAPKPKKGKMGNTAKGKKPQAPSTPEVPKDAPKDAKETSKGSKPKQEFKPKQEPKGKKGKATKATDNETKTPEAKSNESSDTPAALKAGKAKKNKNGKNNKANKGKNLPNTNGAKVMKQPRQPQKKKGKTFSISNVEPLLEAAPTVD